MADDILPALHGLRVLELGEGISAAYCTKLLADLGAEVIKLEPRGGDSTRRAGPFAGDVPDSEASGLFMFLNTNKKSVTVHLDSPDGRELLDKLCERVDAVVENFDPAALDRLDLWPADLQSRHPGVIVTSVSPFGRSGPHARFRGTGLQASAGSSVAFRTGDPKRSPLAKPLDEPEFLGGVHGAVGTLLAVRVVENGGPAQTVDISIQDILASVTSGSAVAAVMFGTRGAPQRSGHRVDAFFPWTVLPVADGYMEFITMQERHWKSFMEFLGDPEWAKDPRFQDIYARAQFAEEVEQLLHKEVVGMTRGEIWAATRQRGISFQPVHRIDDMVNSDQLKHRGYFATAQGGLGASMTVPGAPYKLSETPWQLRSPAPRLGQHTSEVLTGLLGMTQAEVASLTRAGSLF